MDRWKIEGKSITWNLENEERLPHTDHLEMSGKYVSQYIKYNVDERRTVTAEQILVWPWLRMFPNDTHASMKTIGEGQMVNPTWSVNGNNISMYGKRIEFDGILHIFESDGEFLDVERSFFPSMEQKNACMRLHAVNRSQDAIHVKPDIVLCEGTQRGARGIYVYESCLIPQAEMILKPEEEGCWYVLFGADYLHSEIHWQQGEFLLAERKGFLDSVSETIKIETPDEVLNQLFYFAKIRSMESIFWTRAGLLHAPGGLHYYAAVWANDQAEYANPFFAYTNMKKPVESVINCLKLFRRFMGPGYEAIPSSIIAEGEGIWEGKKDRGDAAMYAYGTSRFLLTMGDKELAEEFFSSVVWCLEYCRKQITEEGVIKSDSDELEGRFPHGTTNLSTSCLLYDALLSAAFLAEELKEWEKADEYKEWRKVLGEAIERHFGCTIDGHETYRYCEESEALRSWICIPLVMGIFERKKGTLDALFSPKLWTDDGLLTMEGDHTFWDRSTVYGLRGAFAAEAAEQGIYYLKEYSRRRLLGEHVPYPVEAWPEGDQRHLSAESALYCRIFIEGILGLRPEGLKKFCCHPSLPQTWQELKVDNIQIGGEILSIHITREQGKYHILINGRKKMEYQCVYGGEISVSL